MRLSTDALLSRVVCAGILIFCTASMAVGANYRTTNFIVTAPTPEIAEQCGQCAEHYRKKLAIDWLGKEMPRWYKPCTLTVKVGQIGAGGATTFAFDRGEVFGWRMNVQGSLERVLDSVIPHEVSHTVFASHFRRPLPRWADEGAATLIEHESERRRQAMLLKQVWNTSQRIPLRKLLSIKEYPRDMQQVLTLYAEGYSLADFLVQAGGKTRYLEFLDTAHRHGWERAIKQHYSLEGVDELESRWSNWVMAGSPQLNIPKDSQLASNDQPAPKKSEAPQENFERPIIRGQSPERDQERSQPEEPVANPPRETREAAPPETQPSVAALPETPETPEETAQETPGWRMREKLQEIPADFVNPANDPARSANLEFSQTASTPREPAPTQNNPAPQPGWTPKAADADPPTTEESAAPARSASRSNEPPFRFELDTPADSPGGTPPGNGRSPNWSDFPRN